MYQSVEQAVLFDHADPVLRYGVLSARFVRVKREVEAPGCDPDSRTAAGSGAPVSDCATLDG